jgi:hypothetical protein
MLFCYKEDIIIILWNVTCVLLENFSFDVK